MDSMEVVERTNEREVLAFLTEHGYLEGAAHGVALQVVAKGRESLRGRQVDVYESEILNKYFNLECRLCHDPGMPTSEITAAMAEGDGLCSKCRNLLDRDD